MNEETQFGALFFLLTKAFFCKMFNGVEEDVCMCVECDKIGEK